MIRVIRILEYRYDTVETMEADMARWTASQEHKTMSMRSVHLPVSVDAEDTMPAVDRIGDSTVEIGGQVMTLAQYDAARFPLIAENAPPTVDQVEPVRAMDKVTDLMDALEKSVKEAKDARLRHKDTK